MREVFHGGAVGQGVSALIWLASAALSTYASRQAAVLMLVVGGAFIFPLTQLVLRLLRGRSAASSDNPFNALAMQMAFIVPLCLPVILAATRANGNWFYPAFLVVVGAHYLPFMTLYGMWQYGVLAAAWSSACCGRTVLSSAGGMARASWPVLPRRCGGPFAAECDPSRTTRAFTHVDQRRRPL